MELRVTSPGEVKVLRGDTEVVTVAIRKAIGQVLLTGSTTIGL